MPSALAGNIGSLVQVQTSQPPAALSAGTATSAAVDVRQFESLIHHIRTGVLTGGPTTQTVDSKLQQSVDGTTGWVDLVPPTPYPGTAVAANAQITAASTEKHQNVNLDGVNYVREVVVVAFTGGAAPTIQVASTLVLGGAKKTPLVY